MTRKIITHHVYPPVPSRQFDWCAYYDGEEERGNYGWGGTETAAIIDLKANYFDCDTCEDAGFVVRAGEEHACPDCQPKMADEEKRDRAEGF